jgi:hypothetical protein
LLRTARLFEQHSKMNIKDVTEMRLDQTIPFVNRVFAFMNDEVSAESCVQMLRYYEEKWRVEHVAS